MLKFFSQTIQIIVACLFAALPVMGLAAELEFEDRIERAPMLLAAGGSWEDFSRIRRGVKKADPESEPSEPAPQPKKPSPKTIRESGGSAPQSSRPVPVQAKTKAKAKANARLLKMPGKPAERGSSWAFYRGTMDVDSNNWYDPHGVDFAWTYAHTTPLRSDARIVVFLHGAGDGERAMFAYGPANNGDIEVRVQDAGVHNPDWREWWSFSADGVAYPSRRIVAALEFVSKRHSVDHSARGFILEGTAMGGGGAVVQAMILPAPWRALIAYVSGRMGVLLPRRVVLKTPGQFASLPPHAPRNKALWESIDFTIQAVQDPVVRGIHFRQSFSTSDPLSEGRQGNTQLEFVNTVENQRIGGAFSWVDGGQWMQEEGVTMPDLANFETAEQDITLDRAHPAFTSSTGNHPTRPVDRVDEQTYPHGHYNLGLLWNHAEIIDDASQLVFPLRYQRHTNLGKGIPDQPGRISVSVTPRRPRHFTLVDGESLRWSWDDGARSGSATVNGDTVTIGQLPLVSGEAYKKLRIYRE